LVTRTQTSFSTVHSKTGARFAAALILAVACGGCSALLVDVEAMSRMKRVVILGFYANRDVQLALAQRSFSESRHDGEDILPKAFATFTEKIYKLSAFHLLPTEFITSTQAYKEFRPSRMRYLREDQTVSLAKLKLISPDDDFGKAGAILKAAAVDGGIVVEAFLTTEVRIAEGDTGSVGGRVKLNVWMVDATLARVSGGTYTFPNEIQKAVIEGFERASDEAAARLRSRLP